MLNYDRRILQSPQSFVLATKDRFPFQPIYRVAHHQAIRRLTGAVQAIHRKTKMSVVEAIYIRRGAGRGEFVAGASDLDFFLVLGELSAQDEMTFLHLFWQRFQKLKKLFPFLGETLMGDRNELENWFASRTVRAYESRFDWQHVWGIDVLSEFGEQSFQQPTLRDCYAEGLKYYWALLHPTLANPQKDLRQGIDPWLIGATKLRHGFKAALDLFRIHAATIADPAQADRYWQASRTELLDILPTNIFGDLQLGRHRSLLTLDQKVLTDEPAHIFFDRLAYRALLCLHEIAGQLQAYTEEPESAARVHYHAKDSGIDAYTQSVRELFAERILIRHKGLVDKIVISEMNAQMYFSLQSVPDFNAFAAVLSDIRAACSSFSEFSIVMPMTSVMSRQLKRTSLLDTPFHSCYSHRSLFIDENNHIQFRDYVVPDVAVAQNTIEKTVAELSFSLRFLPPNDLGYIIEKVILLILSLRLMQEESIVETDFERLLDRFGNRYPKRIDFLREKLSLFYHLRQNEEQEFWQEIDSALDRFSAKDSIRASNLKQKLLQVKAATETKTDSKRPYTDLWMDLYPFLRMELNVVKDLVFPKRPVLKL